MTSFHDGAKPKNPPTPGPWRYLRHDGVIVHDHDDRGAREIGWNDADYMLAAAAPSLLAACRYARAILPPDGPTWLMCDAAIAKAEGR